MAADDAVTRNPAVASDGVQVGIARRDGVTVSGAEAYVTRNGVTEKLVKELQLPSGIIVSPDGTVLFANQTKSALQADQLLTFDGHIINVPRDPNVNPAPVVHQSASPAPQAPAGVGAGANRTSVFLGSDGKPFTGTVTSPGAITRSDGTVVPIDGSIQSVIISTDGTSSTGRLNPNGTVQTSNGTIVFPDGSIRDPRGTLLSPATAHGGAAVAPAMLNPQGNSNNVQPGGVNQQNTNPPGTTQSGFASPQAGGSQQFTSPQQGTTNPQPGITQPGAVQSTPNQQQFVTPQGAVPPAGNTGQRNFDIPQGAPPQGNATPGNIVTPQGTSPQGTTTQQPGAGNQFRAASPNFTTGQQPPRQPGNTAPRTQGNTPATNGNAGGAVTNGGTGAGGGAPAGGAGR